MHSVSQLTEIYAAGFIFLPPDLIENIHIYTSTQCIQQYGIHVDVPITRRIYMYIPEAETAICNRSILHITPTPEQRSTGSRGITRHPLQNQAPSPTLYLRICTSRRPSPAARINPSYRCGLSTACSRPLETAGTRSRSSRTRYSMVCAGSKIALGLPPGGGYVPYH